MGKCLPPAVEVKEERRGWVAVAVAVAVSSVPPVDICKIESVELEEESVVCGESLSGVDCYS